LSDQAKETATAAIQEIAKLGGHELGAGELELAVEAVVGIVAAAGNLSKKRASAAGKAAHDAITNSEEAEKAAESRE
jgi:hypothetical protein